jgi:hypothetical protein
MYLIIKITDTTLYSKSYIYKTIPPAFVFPMISIFDETFLIREGEGIFLGNRVRWTAYLGIIDLFVIGVIK